MQIQQQIQQQLRNQNENITILDYSNLNNELDYLFNIKYRKDNLVVKYIYYGYTQDSVLVNDCAKFVLIDSKIGSWKIGFTLKDSIEFLQLNSTESDELTQDIQNLIEKEKYIRNQLIKTNECPKYTYSHKLNFLNKK